MNKKVLISIGAGCALLSLCSCAGLALAYPTIKKSIEDVQKQITTSPTPTENLISGTPEATSLSEYTDSDEGYRLKYPSTWNIDRTSNDFSLVLNAPTEIGSTTADASIYVDTEDLGGEGYSLAEYVNASKQNLQKNITNLMISNENTVKINGQDAHTMTMTGSVNGTQFKWKRVSMLKNEIAYVVTYAAVSTKFNQHEKSAQEITNSFRLN